MRRVLPALLSLLVVACESGPGPHVFRRDPSPLARLEGTWAVKAVRIEERERLYGAGRAYIAFDDDEVRVLQCAYFNDQDLGFFEDTARPCPTAQVKCSKARRAPATRDGEVAYAVREFEPDICRGEDCGPSLRPREWPFLGHRQSAIELHGKRLTLTHSAGAGADDEATAVVTLEPVKEPVQEPDLCLSW